MDDKFAGKLHWYIIYLWVTLDMLEFCHMGGKTADD